MYFMFILMFYWVIQTQSHQIHTAGMGTGLGNEDKRQLMKKLIQISQSIKRDLIQTKDSML